MGTKSEKISFLGRQVSLADREISNVKSWWCGGKEADYTEILYRDEM